ncbi:MAG: hypothetical protein ACR2HZ_04535 [Gemmatimonadaceae bacterium]|jgi:hypothetical protein
MMWTPYPRLATAAALMMVLAACGDGPSEPGDDAAELATFDVAAVAGDQTFEDFAAMRHHQGALGALHGPVPRFGSWSDDCSYNSASATFVCPTATHNAATHSRSYQLFDAAGTPQSAYDPATTASAIFNISLNGSMTREAFTSTFARERTLTVSGLEGAETTRSWSGTASSTHSRTSHPDRVRSRNYVMNSTGVITDLVIPHPFADDAWPLSGTIVRTVNYSREGARGPGRAGSRTVGITFNGTQFVPMTVNDREFTLDLATGKPVRD